MAKMKVHELAKELDRQSKELIAFLQDKGYEVKVAQSSIEDEAIALVRKHFGGAAETPKADIRKEPEKKAESKAETKKETGEEPKTKAAPAKAAGREGSKAPAGEKPKVSGEAKPAPKSEPPKKKKIIFVSNPHNSKMQGQRPPQNGRGGDRRPAGSGRPVQAQNSPHQIIRPTQKPIPVTAEPYEVRQRQQQERRMEQRQQEKRERENANAVQSEKIQQGQERTGSAGENRKSEMQGSAGYGSNQGNRRGGVAGAGANRSQGGPDRSQRGNGGQDNRFRKGNGQKDFIPETPVKDVEKHRDDEKRRANQDRDRRSKKDLIYEDDEVAVKNRNKAGRFIKPEKKVEEPEEQIKVITIPESLTIKDLADKMKIQPSVILIRLSLRLLSQKPSPTVQTSSILCLSVV